ncbi:MAG: SEC-C domain-containing protein, partial [Clostridia bacterium]|nr:SEC-C domain-containing protein [Clostridia bacterium]
DDLVEATVRRFSGESPYPEEWDLAGLLDYARHVFLPDHTLTPADLARMEKEEVRRFLKEKARALYARREEELGAENMRRLERLVLLRVVDQKWMDHLDAMDDLRQGIGLRAYGQRDPLVEYKFEAYQMFQEMIAAIQEDTIRYLFRLQPVAAPARPRLRQVTEGRPAVEATNGGDQERAVRRPVQRGQKIGRNEPCPCGSGKKYKKCCGKTA